MIVLTELQGEHTLSTSLKQKEFSNSTNIKRLKLKKHYCTL